jgi:hypothetical protein
MADTSLSTFLSERQAPLTKAFEAGNVDHILKFYHKDLSFSDHGKK